MNIVAHATESKRKGIKKGNNNGAKVEPRKKHALNLVGMASLNIETA